tara:strand:- start:1 stop:165 length:165 start_codon:yes stop_codon:yes gene_type:complete
MKDAVGKELKVGDTVVYAPYGKQLYKYQIRSFTPQKVRIGGYVISPNSIAKIEP